jgi:hypothetical protein
MMFASSRRIRPKARHPRERPIIPAAACDFSRLRIVRIQDFRHLSGTPLFFQYRRCHTLGYVLTHERLSRTLDRPCWAQHPGWYIDWGSTLFDHSRCERCNLHVHGVSKSSALRERGKKRWTTTCPRWRWRTILARGTPMPLALAPSSCPEPPRKGLRSCPSHPTPLHTTRHWTGQKLTVVQSGSCQAQRARLTLGLTHMPPTAREMPVPLRMRRRVGGGARVGARRCPSNPWRAWRDRLARSCRVSPSAAARRIVEKNSFSAFITGWT